MKKTLLFCFLIIAVAFQAQNNDLNINARWYNSSGEWSGPCVENYDFNNYFTGDTIINGSQYFKLNTFGYRYSSMKGQGSNCPPNGYYSSENIKLVRYHQKKLLIWSSTTNQDNVFLDYTLAVGDSIKNVGYTNSNVPFLIVTNIDSVLINGIYLKKFHYNHSMGGSRYIIEKIGSSHGFINPYSSEFESSSRLNCYSENFVTLYNEPTSTKGCNLTVGITEKINKDKNVTVFPNPTSKDLQINFGDSDIILKLSIQNCLGETVLENNQPKVNFNYDISSLKNGIYFVVLETEKSISTTKFVKQ